ncbi:MAG TPA: proprotein convertase P-domain-containing protein [Thermoanaerobaculia bacterium]|jgi:subtilisin-like proprotein convertase family protein
MRRLAAMLLCAISIHAAPAIDVRLELTRESLLGTHRRYRHYVDDLPVMDGIAPRNFNRVVIDGRRARRVIREEKPLHPVAYYYDLATNELLYREPLYFNARAVVFDPNPVVTTNDPALRDRNDAAAAVPLSAYFAVEVDDDLDGPHVRIVDAQAPSVPPARAGQYDREQDGFEDVNAYFHIDRNQQYLQSLGYTGRRHIVPYAVPVDTHAQNGQDNSLFLPSFTTPGLGALYFGEGGTDDAEDADLLIHEYAHAIHEWIAPGTFGGTFSSESRALAEGFADYWAFSAHNEKRRASGRDPYCLADWDARCEGDDPSQLCAYPPGSDCLRRVDSSRTMASYERSDAAGVDYRNSAIWSSALREIHEAIGKRPADTIVIESLFGAPPRPTFAAIAQRMLAVDRALYGGVNGAMLCAAFSARGILASCNATPRGEETHFQSSDRDLPIPELDPSGVVASITIEDPRTIARLAVRVDVRHTARGDLRVSLIAPDGTEVMLQDLSFERTADIHTTYGIDVAPDEPLELFRGRSALGTWRLRVADLRTRDVGRLISWGLLIQFEGDEPLTRRPAADVRQMVPVVTHVTGANGERFTSEVRLANPSSEARNVTLVFTPSTHDGTISFSATRVTLAAGQTLAFDDVVQSLFRTLGSGSLEVLGDVLVASRTFIRTTNGTFGQQVPANLESTAQGESPLVAASLFSPRPQRFNLGITEIAGGSGFVGDRRIEPFSHLQLPFTPEIFSELRITGSARIIAYVSAVDNVSGDMWFIPAERRRGSTRNLVAPVILSSAWRSDLWLFGDDQMVPLELAARRATAFAGGINYYGGVPRALFGFLEAFGALRLQLPSGAHAQTRVARDGVSQGVPFREVTAQREHHLPWVENSAAFRTNIGIVSDGEATAEVIIYDSAGAEIERHTIATTNGLAQIPVIAPVSAGRAFARILSGRAWAYTSVVDNGTGDATLFN